LSIFNSQGGVSWVGANNWGNTAVNQCNWTGVICNQDGFVVALDLSGFGLTGQLDD
jgi:hypothetical protein